MAPPQSVKVRQVRLADAGLFRRYCSVVHIFPHGQGSEYMKALHHSACHCISCLRRKVYFDGSLTTWGKVLLCSLKRIHLRIRLQIRVAQHCLYLEPRHTFWCKGFDLQVYAPAVDLGSGNRPVGRSLTLSKPVRNNFKTEKHFTELEVGR